MTLPKDQPVAVAAATDEIIDLIRAETKDVSGDLTAESTLQSTGLDSMTLVSLIFKIEARYGITFLDEDGDDIETIGDLANLVARQKRECA